jgi:hypothetical protein
MGIQWLLRKDGLLCLKLMCSVLDFGTDQTASI